MMLRIFVKKDGTRVLQYLEEGECIEGPDGEVLLGRDEWIDVPVVKEGFQYDEFVF